MNRRGFLRTLLGGAAASAVTPYLPDVLRPGLRELLTGKVVETYEYVITYVEGARFQAGEDIPKHTLVHFGPVGSGTTTRRIYRSNGPTTGGKVWW